MKFLKADALDDDDGVRRIQHLARSPQNGLIIAFAGYRRTVTNYSRVYAGASLAAGSLFQKVEVRLPALTVGRQMHFRVERKLAVGGIVLDREHVIVKDSSSTIPRFGLRHDADPFGDFLSFIACVPDDPDFCLIDTPVGARVETEC